MTLAMRQNAGSLGENPQWLALSDHYGPLHAGGMTDLLQRGSLIFELSSPRTHAAVLLDYRSDVGWPRTISVFHDTDAGMILLHRQGDRIARHVLPGPLPGGWDLARLTYSWDGPARHWTLKFEDAAGDWAHFADGINPMPMVGADLLAMCAGQKLVCRDASVDWFGVCLNDVPAAWPAVWMGQRTPINTKRGKVAIGDLQSGDLIATLDNGYVPLRKLSRMILPNRGRFAPVLLRAPYFGHVTDLLVAGGQLTLLSGAAVEYLFGEDAVLAPVSALCDGNAAMADVRRPLTACVALDLGSPQIVFADSCPLLCQTLSNPAALPYRLLQDYETLPLQSLLGRIGPRCAA